jgi:uncharacterized protein (TIGR03067 family)
MNPGMSLFLILGVAIGGAATDEKKELDKFKGAWEVSELTYNGKDHSSLKLSLVFKDKEMVVEGNDRVKKEYARVAFKIDPATTPKLFDITILGGSQKDAAMEGIYEFKGDELRLCVKVQGNDRPAEFAAPEGSSTVLLVLKRTNP